MDLTTPSTAPRLYQVKIHPRRRLTALPTHQQGWWNSQPNGELVMRDATAEDLTRVFLKDGASRDPADYLHEAHGTWVLLRAAAQRIEPLSIVATRPPAPADR